jgi:hypothetical protein
MKIKELAIEHLTVALPKNSSWLTNEIRDNILNNGVKLIRPLKMLYGDFNVYRWENVFGVISQNNELYALMELKKYNDTIWQMKKFERIFDSKKNTTDLAAALFSYIVLDLQMNILSDNVMSPLANKFWKSQFGRIPIAIYDAFTEKHYMPSQVGQLTKTMPKVIILSPDDDKWKIDIDENGNEIGRKEYRWFWLATTFGNDSFSHYLKEEIEDGRDKAWIMFGLQEYPNEIS